MCFACPSQVTGASGRLYTCFVSCHYCPCPAFTYTVLRRNIGLLVSLTCCAILKNCLVWPGEKKKPNPYSPIRTWSLIRQKQQLQCEQHRLVTERQFRCNLTFFLVALSDLLQSWSKHQEDPGSLEDAAKTSVRNWAVHQNMDPPGTEIMKLLLP